MRFVYYASLVAKIVGPTFIDHETASDMAVAATRSLVLVERAELSSCSDRHGGRRGCVRVVRSSNHWILFQDQVPGFGVEMDGRHLHGVVLFVVHNGDVVRGDSSWRRTALFIDRLDLLFADLTWLSNNDGWSQDLLKRVACIASWCDGVTVALLATLGPGAAD